MAKRIAISPRPGASAFRTRRGGRVVVALAAAACFAGMCAAAAAPARAGSALDQLRLLRDEARPIVVVSDAPGDPRVAAQLSALDRAERGLAERDMRVLREARGGGPLRAALGLPDHGFAVVLLGKDGTIKAVWHAPVEPARVFALIDAMPMRRREMRRRGVGHG